MIQQRNGSPDLLPIDEAVLAAEMAAGETCYLRVPLSQTHLFVLVAAAQLACAQKDCPQFTRLHLDDFQLWCARDAQFGPETRKLLAWYQAQLRNGAGAAQHGTETDS